MASKKKRVITKSKRKKTPLEAAQKGDGIAKEKIDQQEAHHKEETARKRVSQRKPTRSRRPARVVKDTIGDQIDEPLPGVMRVTEIAEVRVAVLDEGARRG